MHTVPLCLTCILGDVFAAAQQVTDGATALEVARQSAAYLAEHFGYSEPPSYHITAVHRILKRVTGLAEPFSQQRWQANEIGVAIAAGVAQEAAFFTSKESRFRHLATWALAANSLDSRTVGTGYAFDPSGTHAYLSGYLQRGVTVDQIAALYQAISAGPQVLYILDNVGEVALDGLLIEEMRRHGCRVVAAARGGSITSDATMADAVAVGLHRAADALILAGPDTLGVSFAEMSPELHQALARADLVLTKGQANYYVFSEYRREVPGKVFSLFTIKCEPVASLWGVTRGSTVAAFLD